MRLANSIRSCKVLAGDSLLTTTTNGPTASVATAVKSLIVSKGSFLNNAGFTAWVPTCCSSHVYPLGALLATASIPMVAIQGRDSAGAAIRQDSARFRVAHVGGHLAKLMTDNGTRPLADTGSCAMIMTHGSPLRPGHGVSARLAAYPLPRNVLTRRLPFFLSDRDLHG